MIEQASEVMTPPDGRNLTLPLGHLPTDNSDVWITRWPDPANLAVCWHGDSRLGVLCHCFSSPDVEVGGVLLGKAYRTAMPVEERESKVYFVEITAAIVASHTDAGQSHIKFTQETWAEINLIRDREYPDSDIVGWYHSHPGHGVMLSGHDLFLHNNFFAQPFQLALVIDTYSRRGAFFAGSKSLGGPYKSPEFKWDHRYVNLLIQHFHPQYEMGHEATLTPLREQVSVDHVDLTVSEDDLALGLAAGTGKGDQRSTVLTQHPPYASRSETTRSLVALASGLAAICIIRWLVVPTIKLLSSPSTRLDGILISFVILTIFALTGNILHSLMGSSLRRESVGKKDVLYFAVGMLLTGSILWGGPLAQRFLPSLFPGSLDAASIGIAIAAAIVVFVAMLLVLRYLDRGFRGER